MVSRVTRNVLWWDASRHFGFYSVEDFDDSFRRVRRLDNGQCKCKRLLATGLIRPRRILAQLNRRDCTLGDTLARLFQLVLFC